MYRENLKNTLVSIVMLWYSSTCYWLRRIYYQKRSFPSYSVSGTLKYSLLDARVRSSSQVDAVNSVTCTLDQSR